jgi:hypothetical protein
MPETDDKITLENFTSPGHTYRVDRRKYEAMRDALLAVLPREAPGLSVRRGQDGAAAAAAARTCFLAAPRRAGG